MKKRIISILLCTVMLLCAIPFSASGAESAESVVFKGDALLSAVTNASQSAANNNRKFEVVDGNLKYTRLREDTNLVNFDLNFGTSYVDEYKYVGLKYRIDLSGVDSAMNYSVTKICVDGNFNAADGLAINTGNELKCTSGVVGWGLGTGKEAWTRLCVMGNGTRTDGTVVENGKFTPVNFVLVIEELVLFKTREAMFAYQGTEAPKTDTETGFVYSGSRLETVYDYYYNLSRNLSVDKATDGDYAKLTSNLTVNSQSSRFYIPLNSFSTTENSFFVLKYRYNGQASCDNASLKIMRVMNDSTGDPATTDGVSATVEEQLKITADGEWHELVIDLTTVNFDGDAYLGKTWATNQIKGIYLMPWLVPDSGSEFDIEVLGFVKDQAAADLALGKEPADTTAADTTPEETTPTDTTPEAEAPEDTEAAKEKGCGSFIGMTSVAFVSAAAAIGTVVAKKRRED